MIGPMEQPSPLQEAPSAAGDDRLRRRPSPVLLYWIGFLADVGAGIVVVALPFAAMQLGATVSAVGIIGGLFMGLYAVACLLVGPFIDRVRPRRVMLFGQIAQGAVSLLMGLAGQQWLLLALSGSFGALMVTIWPPALSWLSHGHEGPTLNRRLAWFNVSWCSGLVLGPLIGGVLYGRLGPLAAFSAAALVLAGSGLLALLVTEPQPTPHHGRREEEAGPVIAARPDAAVFRFMARVSVVVCTAAAGLQRFQVPSLAKSLRVSEEVFGFVMFLLSLGNMICFLVLGRTQRWHYRAWMLWAAQLAIAAATLWLVRAQHAWQLAVVAAATGLCGGIAYSSSLYYGVSGGRRRAALAAIHEMLLSAGFVTGAIGSGMLSRHYELRTPYPVLATVIAAAVFVQIVAYIIVMLRVRSRGL